MTTTITRTVETGPAELSGSTRSLWRTAAVAGVAAGVATIAVAAMAHAIDVPLETAPGEAIPIVGFGQLTGFFTVVGALIARAFGRRARAPRSTLLKTTLVLTALSLVPDALISAGIATKATFMLTHLVAAAIVIPALMACVPERATR